MPSDNLNWTVEYYEENISNCNEIIQNIENFDRITLVNKDNITNFKDGDLVRYQGMIQDMLNPEYYYASYSVQNRADGVISVKSGKYRDIADVKENEELNLDEKVPDERLVFYCVPIPGMSAWVKNHLNENNKKTSVANFMPTKKRSMDEEEISEMILDVNTNPSNQNKKPYKFSSDAKVGQNTSNITDKFFPINEDAGLPCILKIYEQEDHCNIFLNDKVEAIGFLSLNPALEDNLDEADAEDKAHHPPPSLVPRIHAIFCRKLEHNNPLLKHSVSTEDIISDAEKIRSDLHLTFSQILYGDHLAADYLICCLLSRVYARTDGEALGKFSLNLSNISKGTYSRHLYSFLEKLVTNSEYIPLSIESLNEKSFIPKKDYETNRLLSGRLQLPEDTALVLDETEMNEGKLQHIGCLNVAALQHLIREQEINYDFSYYSVKYNTNIPILVLSEGKSIFETDVTVKLQPDLSMTENIDQVFEAATFFLKGEVSRRIRMYLTCMRLQEFKMSDEMMRKIGDDYVKMRQEEKGITTCDLHNLLVLSRLLALSYGRTSLGMTDWLRALEMETERKSRFS